MSPRLKLVISILAGALFLVLGVSGSAYLKSKKEPPKVKERTNTKPVALVDSVVNTNQQFEIRLEGTLQAFNKVSLFSEVPGVIENKGKAFKVGSSFSKGEALLRINKEEAQLSLLGQKSEFLSRIVSLLPDIKLDFPDRFEAWEAYVDNFDLNGAIADLPAAQDKREKSFIASRNLNGVIYGIRSAEKRLAKYTMEAPFSGVLTAVNTNQGAMVQPGQVLGEFMERGNFELVVSVLASDIKYIKIGQQASFYSEDLGKEWTGRIVRIADKINPRSQTLDVFVQLRGKDLKEGLFLSGTVASKVIADTYLLDKELLVGQEQAYVVIDDKLSAIDLDIVRISEEGILVRNLAEGTLLLTRQISGAFEGMEVQVEIVGAPK